jgi:hypothetical protein
MKGKNPSEGTLAVAMGIAGIADRLMLEAKIN